MKGGVVLPPLVLKLFASPQQADLNENKVYSADISFHLRKPTLENSNNHINVLFFIHMRKLKTKITYLSFPMSIHGCISSPRNELRLNFPYHSHRNELGLLNHNVSGPNVSNVVCQPRSNISK